MTSILLLSPGVCLQKKSSGDRRASADEMSVVMAWAELRGELRIGLRCHEGRGRLAAGYELRA